MLDPGLARSGTGFHDYTGGLLAKYRSRYPRVRVKALKLQAEKEPQAAATKGLVLPSHNTSLRI